MAAPAANIQGRISREDLERMIYIRSFEAVAAQLKADGLIPGSLHDCRGQEAVAAGVCAEMSQLDVLFSGHRGLGHCLARGIDPVRLLEELLGMGSGFAEGHAGSMHIFDPEVGVLGTNGIVGSSLPLAVGAAMSFQTMKTGACAVAFFGEGAVTTGAFHEAMYLAGLWQLPVLFVCEHNGYIEFTPSESVLLNRTYLLGDYYDVESFPVDGVDVSAVRESAHAGLEWARSGRGPALIDCRVYRFGGHYEGDTQTYRRPGEATAWQEEFDPINRAAVRLAVDHESLSSLVQEVRERIEVMSDEIRGRPHATR